MKDNPGILKYTVISPLLSGVKLSVDTEQV